MAVDVILYGGPASGRQIAVKNPLAPILTPVFQEIDFSTLTLNDPIPELTVKVAVYEPCLEHPRVFAFRGEQDH